MDTTSKGWPFPEGPDAITDYPAVAQSLAEKLEAEQDISGATIAAIDAQVGGGAEGRRALVSAGASPRKLAMEWDPVLGKWVGPESWHPIIAGGVSNAGHNGAGLASGGSIAIPGSLNLCPFIPMRAMRAAGLVPQIRVHGLFGITFTGATTSRAFFPVWRQSDLGITDPHGAPHASDVLGGEAITALASAPALHDGGWQTHPGVNTRDYGILDYYLTAVGTGTWSYVVKHVSFSLRWVSA